MSSMGSQSNKDRSKTASSATVTRLFQKSLRDLITGTSFLSRVVKLNSLLPASAAAPKIKLNCATMILLLLLICFVETQ